MAIWGNEAKAGALWEGFYFCLSSVYFHSYFMMWTFGSGFSPTHSNSSVGGREAHDEAMIIATAKLLLYSGFLKSNKPLMQPGTQMFTMYATLTSSKGRQNLFSPLKAALNDCWPLEGSIIYIFANTTRCWFPSAGINTQIHIGLDFLTIGITIWICLHSCLTTWLQQWSSGWWVLS